MTKKFISKKLQMRSGARLAAIQALYVLENSDRAIDLVLRDFINGEIGKVALVEDFDTDTEELTDLSDFDTNFFASIVRGVYQDKEKLEGIILKSFSEEWNYERVDYTLRAALFCAVWELLEHQDIDAKVIIKEYVDIAYSFYDKSEPRMVNAILDSVSHILRSSEF